MRDGKKPVLYQQQKTTRKGRGRLKEKGYLQVDEMKLKHGVVFNSMTGEIIGLADDMLDMESVMTRILSEEGDTIEAAVYVNLWQYVAFGIKGLETWPCEHFFNDGSLSGNTMTNEFMQVVRNYEWIESEVYGLVLDAGGNNSRFINMLQD